ncbi:M20/M25/M40 family metallo-hydrolase [Halomonas sp. ML-15]|uniref:M20/M25/M40 family metallo-hydrolase n=1 Tax=Halomonas sp. ML-15 TaxID=2773305 RepID=UPI0017465EE9|nr:M20/M25/M40 family metallo-hydrolase [Halomonas sp. ML-15]MBD3894241.1 M20/M25/M40 family metallo-hydrolase [Halomonas sp. ML-15]
MSMDTFYLEEQLLALLAIPSPSLHTTSIADHLADELARLGLTTRRTVRGDLLAETPGSAPRRAITAHLDTLGAMVVGLKENGRLAVRPIGSWNARFADGARVKLHGEAGEVLASGTLLPTLASGHVYNEAVDRLPADWAHIELRLDLVDTSPSALRQQGIEVGALVSIDSQPSVTDSGFINARHLDNKAAIACLLAAIRAGGLPGDVRLVFSCAEELGVGITQVMFEGIEEVLNLDIAAQGEGQNVCHDGVTIAMLDSLGPLHPVATQRLIALCREHQIPFSRDCFPYYYCDGDAAAKAGLDVRNGLACFGADASHGWERVHRDSLLALSRLVRAWLAAPLQA